MPQIICCQVITDTLHLKVTSPRWAGVRGLLYQSNFSGIQHTSENKYCVCKLTEMETFLHCLLLHLWPGELVSHLVLFYHHAWTAGFNERHHLSLNGQFFHLQTFCFILSRTFVMPVTLPTVVQYFVWAPTGNRYVSLEHVNPTCVHAGWTILQLFHFHWLLSMCGNIIVISFCF